MNRHPKIPLIFLILLLLPAVVKAETSLTRTIESGWHLVSFPMSLDGSNLCEVMPEATAVSVKGGKYEICGNETNVEIAAGHAYWVYSESAKRVLLKGVLRTSGSLTLNLEKGWNLIGPPSSYSIKWDDQIKIDGIELSKSTKIKGSLLKYDTATGTYTAATEMEPWTGYIVYANEACTVEFPAEATDEVTYKSFAATDVTTENGVAVVKKQLTLLRAEGVTDAALRTLIAAAGGTLVGYNPYLGVYQVEMPDGTDLTTAATTMKRTSAVAAATPNVVFGVTDYTPADPPYAAGADATRSWGFVRIGAPKVWKIYTGTGTKVAVIDTGVDGTQTDLAGRVTAGADFIDAAGNAAQDSNGHGTHIAGIIAAAGDNGTGIAGVCWNCTVVPVRACDAQGNCPFYSVLNAIVYAVNNGASVINLSIAGAAQKDSDAWKIFQSVIDYAASSDVVVVAAAGNSGADASGTIPAALDGVLAVGATDAADARALFSNYGTAVDLGAPGAGIYSLEPGGGAGYRDGTSAAAAFAAGAAAYVRSVQPGMAASAVTELLKSNADALAAGVDLGAGRLNLQKTLGAIATGNTAPVITAVNVGSSEIARGGGTKIKVTASDADGDSIAYGMTADGGTLTADGDNEWTWSAPDTRGEYQVTAAVSDGRGGTDTATASIKVDIENLKSLRITPGLNYLYQGDIVQFDIYGEFDDAMVYPLHAVWEMGSPHGVVTPDGKFTALAVGDALFSARVGDKLMNFVVKVLATGETPPSLNLAGFVSPNPIIQLGTSSAGEFVALGDVNGDTYIDAVIGEWSASSRVYFGLGNGKFNTTYTSITDLNCQIRDINLADIDGDGDLDLGAACESMQGYRILKNNGSGTFALSQSFGVGTMSGTSINFADMKHHMMLDVIGGDAESGNQNHIFVNDETGNGTFTETAINVGSSKITNHIEPGDFNGDGYLDFVEANSPGLAVYTYNTSSTSGIEFIPIGSSPNSSENFSVVVAGEIKGGGVGSCDGKLDLVVSNMTTNKVSLYQGLGNGTFSSITSLGSGPYYFLSIGDKDNNKMPEIFAGTESGISSSLFSIGDDTQACGVSYNTKTDVTTTSWEGRFADLDNDNDLDLITAGPVVAQNDVWLNDASASVSNAVPAKPTAASCTATSTEFIISWSPGSDDKTLEGLLSYDVRIKDYSGTNYMLSGVGQAGFGTYGFPQRSGAQYSIAYRYGTDIPQGHYKFNVRTVDGAYNRSPWYSQPDDIDCNHAPVVSNVGFTPSILLNNGISETVFKATVVDYNGADDIVTNQILMTGITGDTTPVTIVDDATHGDGIADNYVYGTPIIGQTDAVKTPADANYTGTYSYTVVDLSGETYTKNDSITIVKWPEPDVCSSNWPAYKCNEHHGSKSDNALIFYPFMTSGSCSMASSASPIAFESNEYIPGSNGYLYRCKLVSTGSYSSANKLITSSTSIPITAPGAIVSSPSKIIYLASSDGKIYANNIDSTMSSYWSTPYTGFTGAISTPPIVQKSALTSTYDMVFAASEAGEVHAINKTTKAAVWTTTVSGAVKAAPAIKNGILYIADANGNVYGIDTITGNKMWTRSLSGKVPVSSVTTSISHSEIYVTSTDGNLYALNVAAGTPVWQFTDSHSNTFADSPAYTASGSDDLLYIGDSGGYLYEIKWDGATKTTRELSLTSGSAINVPPIYMNGILYVGAANGYLYAVGTSGSSMTMNSSKKICTTGGITGAMAATSDGLFVYCSGDNKLYKVIQNTNTCPVVTSYGDSSTSGSNTLRECITKANSDSTMVNITFDPTKVNQPIKPTTPLPELTKDNIVIDGGGYDITIDGTSCPNCDGFVLKGNNQSIRNLNIIKFDDTACTRTGTTNTDCAGIAVNLGSTLKTASIYGNYIGTNSANLTGSGNYYGIYVWGASGGIDIGYTDTGGTTYGNVISANNYIGIVLEENASNVKIKGNKIGTTADGTSCANSSSVQMGNKGGGIAMTNATSNTIGVSSTYTGERNIISCNGVSGASPGILISSSVALTAVQGNYIGVCSDGSTACGNYGPGIKFYSAGTGNTVGNTGTAKVNVISSNKMEGIRIENTSGVTIENARIGLPASGDYTDRGNLYGIYIADSTSQNNNILSVNDDETRIAYSGNAGIYIEYGNIHNKVSKVLLYSNKNYSSSQEPIHVVNNQITRPIITLATSASITVSTSCAGCTVDLYQVDDTTNNITADGTGYGAGPIYLGTETTNSSGIATFTGITLTNGSYLTALVTNTSGSTSRYAANKELLTDSCASSTPTVSNTSDANPGSLRKCIEYANSTAGAQTIKFSSSIANQTISVSSQLPDINDSTGATTIDGESNGITLSGASCSNCNGLVFKKAGTVKNLKIISFSSGAGVSIDGASGATVQSNTIGYGGANKYGVMLTNGATNNQIGGDLSAEGNLISSNEKGIYITGLTSGPATTGNKVYGNTIGLDSTKTASSSNVNGIYIEGNATGNQIGGGTTLGTDDYRNVIAGNSYSGIYLSSANGNYIQRNIIGLKLQGVLGQPTGTQQNYGIYLDNSGSNLIGGAPANSEGNIIGKNKINGIYMTGDGTDNNKIFGNYIGTDSGGADNYGNGNYGILLMGGTVDSNIIGSDVGSRGNIIAFNGNNGIYISGDNMTKNRISSNQIYKNGSSYLAIDLDDSMNMNAGHTPNDTGDGDGYANMFMNYPVITSASTTSVSGTIDSASCASSACRVEVYAVDYKSGSFTVSENTLYAGDMYAYVGTATATTLVSGTTYSWTASITLPSPSSSVTKVTAITIDGDGNTSEPSDNFTLTTSGCPVTTNADSGTGSLRECITYVNSHAGEDITFSISNSTITLSSALPALNANGSDIDATGKNIVLDCNSGAWNGLEIQSDTNVISGLSVVNCNQSGKSGIYLNWSSNTTLSGNVIGTDFTKTDNKGNYYGVLIKGATSVDIGTVDSFGNCVDPVYGDNTVSGNKESGIYVDESAGGTSEDVKIYCNYIGLVELSTVISQLPNGKNGTSGAAGVKLQGDVQGTVVNQNTIVGHRNGTAQAGIYFAPNGATTGPSGSYIRQNYIGRTQSGSAAGNIYGIWIESSRLDTSKSPNYFESNYIENNSSDGIYINENGSVNKWNEITENEIKTNVGQGIRLNGNVYNNYISKNIIYDNLGIGIDLNGYANSSITPPQIVSVTANGSNYDFEVDLSGCPTTKCRLELFKAENTATPVYADFPAGEGYAYVTTSGYVTKTSNYTFSNVDAGSTTRWFTVTMTDLDGNTSEFSVNAHIPETAPSDCDGADWPKYHCNEVNAGVDTETLTKPFYAKWTQTAGGAIEGGAAVYNDVVYYGDSGGSFHAIKVSDGSISTGSWPKTGLGSIKAAPAVAGTDLIIFGTANNNVYAVKADGTYKWSKPLDAVGDAVESSPVVANGYAYVATNAGNIYALNLTNGDIDATYASGTKVSTGLVYVNGKIIFTSQDFSVYALDAESLGFLWKYTTGAALTSSPLVTNQKVYFGSADGKIYAVNENTGDVEWSTSVGEQVNSGPVITGGYLFIGSNSGKVYRVSATDGSGLQTYSTAGGAIVSSPAVVGTGANTMIVFGSKDKYVYAIDTSGTLLWKSPTAAGGECNSSPAVARSTIFIGCSDSKMYAYANDPAPVVEINNPNASTWEKANFTVDVTNSDTGSGLFKCEWRVLSNSVQTLAWTTYGCSTDPTATVGASAYCKNEGTDKCEVFFRATDNNGTVSAVVSRKFSIDFTAPAAGPVTPAGTSYGSYVDGTFTVTTTFTDSTSGVASCQYCKSTDGTCDTEWTSGTWGSGTCSVTGGLTCTDGQSLTLNMRATDTAGNVGTATAVTRTCDAEAPVTTDDVPTTTTWVNTDQTVTLTPTDTRSGVAATYYCVDTAGTCTPNTSGISVTVSCASGTVCAAQYIRYYSVDNVGNAESTKMSSVIKIDKQLPTVTINSPAASSWQKAAFTADVTNSDGTGGSGLSSCYYRVLSNSVPTLSWTTYTCSADPTITVGVAANCRDEGADMCQVEFYDTDNATNTGLTVTRKFSIDYSLPTVAITSPAPSSWKSADFEVDVTNADTGGSGLDSCYYRVLSNEVVTKSWGTYTCATDPTITVGTGKDCRDIGTDKCKIEFYDTDVAGNIGTTVTLNISMSGGGPTVAITSPLANTWEKSDFALSVTDTDNSGSGWSGCSYTVESYNGSSWVTTKTSASRTCESATPVTITVGLSGDCRNEGTGTCRVTVSATDNAGNTGADGPRLFNIDWTGPAAGTVTPAGTSYGSYVDGTFTVTTTFTDSHSGVDSCQYCKSTDGICDTEWTSGAWGSGTCSVTGGLTCTDGQSLTLNMRATDAVGNVGTATAVTRTCDAEAPTTTDNAPSTWQSTDQTVTLTPTDTKSGVAATYYCVDTAGTCTPNTSGTSVTVSCASGTVCAAQYIRYYSVDNVGNAESTKMSSVIKIDKQLPTVTFNNPAASSWQKSDFDIDISDTDSTGSGLDKCEYMVESFDGSDWTTTKTWSSRVCDSTTSANISVGSSGDCNEQGAADTCRVTVRATDEAGNSTTAARTFKIDWTGPEVAITSPAPSSWQSVDFEVDVTNEDTGGSGLDSCYYRVLSNEVETKPWATYACATKPTITVGTGKDCRDIGMDKCKIEFYDTDVAGNIGTTVTLNISFGGVPTVTFNNPDVNSWQKDNFYIDISDSDNSGTSITCKYRVSYLSGVTYFSSKSLTTRTCNSSESALITVGIGKDCRAQGTNACMVTVTATDETGQTTTVARRFSIDWTAPTVEITSPPASTWEKDDFAINVNNTDNLGLLSCEMRVESNGVETQSWTTYDCTSTPNVTVGATANCKDEGADMCEVFFRAADNAGNVSTPVSRKFSIDWTAPTVSIDNPAPGSWQGLSGFTVETANADTGGSNLSQCDYRVLSNGVVTQDWSVYACASDPSAISVGALATCSDQGSNMCQVEARATDAAGNSATATRQFSIDYSLPVVNPVVFNPTWVNVDGSTTSTITATVTDEAGSTAISTVEADLSALNAGTITLYDDGTHGDTSASDNVYTNDAVAAGSGATCGTKTAPVTATDVVGKTGSGDGTILLNGAPQVASVTFSPNVVVPGGGSYTVFVKFTDCNGNSAVTSAVIDLSTVGVPGLTTLYNDGTHGDVTSGDDTFTGNGFTVPVGWTIGIYTALTTTVTDAGGLTDTLDGTLTVSNVIPDPPVINSGIGTNGSIKITLTAPTTNTDGTALTDLAQHNLYWSATPGGPYAFATQTVNTVPGAKVYMTHTDSFTWYSSYCYVATAVTVSGSESAYSNEECVVAIPPSYTFDDACAETDSNIYHPQSWPSYVNRPDDVAYDTATGHLFVADTDNNRINEFDPAIPCSHVATYGSYGSALGDLHAPTGIVRAPDGLLYIADYNNRIQVMDTSGNFLRQWTVSQAYSVAADDSGYIYVSTLTNKIYKFDSSGNVQGGWPVDANTPKGIDVDASGNIYYASTNLNQIVVLNSSGAQTGTIGNAGSGYGQFTKIQWVTVDRTNGLVYASDYTANRVSVFTLSGALTNILGAAGSGEGYMRAPFGGTVLPDGRVYFADFYNNRIAGFTMP